MKQLRAVALMGAAAVVAGMGFLGAEPQKSVWDGVYTEAQAKRGKEVYDRECASCHGDTLSGGEEAPPLAGDAFLANWNGSSVGDLFERIRRTMPQDNPGRLTRQQDADMLAHIFSVNRFPAGKAELDTQTETLKQIRLEAAKPAQAN
jgi:mono/diheme cytochrome c family protein